MTVFRSSQPCGYLYDDWEDGEMVARDRTVPPQSSNQPYKLFRPCWSQGNGAPAVGNGYLEFAGDGTSHEAIHTSHQTEGAWELTANYNGGTSGNFSTHLLTDYDLTSRVTLYTNPSDGRTNVYAKDADGNLSTVVSNTATDLSSAEHSFRVTIDRKSTR